MKRATQLTLIACAAAALLSDVGAAQKRGAGVAPKQPAQKTATKTAGATQATAPAIDVQVIDEAGLAALVKSGAEKGQPLLVNFWATWCGPCREEFPDLIRVGQEFGKDGGLRFVTVSTDDPADIKGSVTEFLASVHAESVPSYLFSASDAEKAIGVVDKDWSGELPATFLYGRDGQLVFRHTGRVKVEELRAAINAALQKEN